jgi:transcription antitermination factor NusG
VTTRNVADVLTDMGVVGSSVTANEMKMAERTLKLEALCADILETLEGRYDVETELVGEGDVHVTEGPFAGAGGYIERLRELLGVER